MTLSIVNTDSFVDSVSNGVTCSHSLEDNPMVNEVEQHLSTVSIVANKRILRKKRLLFYWATYYSRIK